MVLPTSTVPDNRLPPQTYVYRRYRVRSPPAHEVPLPPPEWLLSMNSKQ